jgi:hypothetical protein
MAVYRLKFIVLKQRSFMKPVHILSIMALSMLFVACRKNKEDKITIFQNLDCGELKTALLDSDDATVDAIMDDICADFPPTPTITDTQGHLENLDNIIAGLNEQCPALNASLSCYACLESLPPWSVIVFSLDSAGVTVKRTAGLLTPSDGVMRSNW